ncbi:MAG: hypothetical protein AB7E48_00990 [Deferribacterales bacterium]
MKDLLERVLADKPECMMTDIQDTTIYQGTLYRFIVEEYWQNNASVNIFQVCGSCHPDYINSPWIYILTDGKRIKRNLEMFRENPGYYTESATKDPTMFYTKHDNVLYLSGDGNHRTAIAKAYFHYIGAEELKGVKLTDNVIDHALAEAFSKLQTMCAQIKKPTLIPELISQLTARDDGAGWQKNRFKLTVKLMNVSSGNIIFLNTDEIYELIEEMKSNPLFRMFRSNRYAKFLR